MQNSNIAQPRDESTKSLHDYLSNNYYKHFLALSLILMFAIVFYLIYLIIDSLIDKSYHYKLSLDAFEKYEKSRLNSKKKTNQTNGDIGVDEITKTKDQNEQRQIKIEFTIWTNRNLQISFIHSLLCSIWLIRIIWFRNTEMFQDLLTYVSWDTYLVLAFSCGYFLYDFYDIYANGYFQKEWVVCLHHWIVLISFSYHMMNLLNIGYTIVALLMEFNSVFLHSRKLLKFYQFDSKSTIVKLNNFLNIATFIFFRFGVLGIIYYGIFHDGDRVTTNYLIMLCSCVFAMTIINIVLFKRILIKDCLSSKPKNANIYVKEQLANSSNNNMIENNDDYEQIECASLIEINSLDNCSTKISNLHDNELHKLNNGHMKLNGINNHNHITTTTLSAALNDDPNNNMVIKKSI